MRVLVIEDETGLQADIRSQLETEGYIVDTSGEGNEGLFFATEYPLDAAIIDIGLPGISGIEIIQRLRNQGNTLPVLILTARSRWQEKVEGLEAGADDYLVKPFRFEELQARLNALLRRAAGWSKPVIDCGPVSLDTGRQVLSVAGQPVELTAFEYRVLEHLMLHAGQVVSKAELTDNIYDQDYDRNSNVLEVFIGRLRRKLDPDNRIKPIETLRGRGYRFRRETGAES